MSMIKLESCDGDVFTVEEQVAKVSVTIKTMIEDCAATENDEPVLLPNISTSILKKVIEWAEFHKNDAPAPEEDEMKKKRTDDLMPWARNFLRVDQDTLLELIVAANFLDIKSLMDAACKTVAHMIKDLTPEEIRKNWNIENDLGPVLEAQIKAENSWCDDL